MLSLGFVQHTPATSASAFEPRTGTGGLIALTPGQVWSADPAPGRELELEVTAGEVWVTQAGDRIDHIVRAGERLLLSRAGRIVIQATQGSMLRIDRPDAARPDAARSAPARPNAA